MKFLEKDLEDIIWESNNEKLEKKGFSIKGKKIRQLRIGNYGISDIITVEKQYNKYCLEPFLLITVFELKKEKAGISAFLQALRYCKGIKTYLEIKKPNINFNFKIVLCAKEIDTNSDYIFLCDFIKEHHVKYSSLISIENYSYVFDLDGIIFKKESNYDLTNNGF